MPVVNHTELLSLTRQMFEKAGASPEEAAVVAEHLVEANLVGHDSHGVIRAVGYARGMQKSFVPASAHEVVKETPATAVINAHGGLGIVAARRAMDLAIEKAKRCTFGAVGVHRCTHTGRIGAYPPRAAAQGMIGIALLNGGGRFTAPFGGTEGRLPPNPIAVSIPRKNGEPVMLDITTSVVAGGKIELKRARGEPLPEGWMIDAEGNYVTDPHRRWGRSSDPAAVLPLGGFQFGHKGYGLGFIVDCLAGGLTWAGCSQEPPTRGGSGFLALAIKIEDFIPLDEYLQEVEALIAFVKSSRTLPGVEEILIPGELEQRTRAQREREGIFIEEETWNALMATARELGVHVEGSLLKK
ncbi:MAG: Ldh family oxidoreductase [Abditibacteriales bacterium]|nr:Ldh family oxidoreductase [Abditibacteriales bacterium]MDW8364384.1 Ldh family oxidoreductase [Abditibacteriales bacterium]